MRRGGARQAHYGEPQYEQNRYSILRGQLQTNEEGNPCDSMDPPDLGARARDR